MLRGCARVGVGPVGSLMQSRPVWACCVVDRGADSYTGRKCSLQHAPIMGVVCWQRETCRAPQKPLSLACRTP